MSKSCHCLVALDILPGGCQRLLEKFARLFMEARSASEESASLAAERAILARASGFDVDLRLNFSSPGVDPAAEARDRIVLHRDRHQILHRDRHGVLHAAGRQDPCHFALFLKPGSLAGK